MIGAAERTALGALSFNPAPTPDDVWRPSPWNVPELHAQVVTEILSGVGRARREENNHPLTVATQGLAGSGKTHLLGAVRERIQGEEFGGFFFLVNLINGKTFWECTALGIVEGLEQAAPAWGTQLRRFHRQITSQLGLPPHIRDAITGDVPLTPAQLDVYIAALRTHDRTVGRECQDTARALVLYGAQDFEQQDIGYAHLMSELGDPAGRQTWGVSPAVRPAHLIVRDISRLIALTLNPSVIAVDQIDTLFAQSQAKLSRLDGGDPQTAGVVAPVADGLLTLRDSTRRTLVVISCLPDTWELLRAYAPGPVLDRIQLTLLPDRVPTPEIGRALVAKRFGAGYAEEGYTPPYETWPIRPEAFADAVNYTPRRLLKAAYNHVKCCLDRDEITELAHLGDSGECGGTISLVHGDLRRLDQRFADLMAVADVSAALDPKTEDVQLPVLLAAGLSAWIDEQALTGATYKHDPLPGKKPALHGRLVEVIDEATENEAHWGFRAIASPNAISVITRVKAACTKVGLDQAIPQRRLVLLRNTPWPNGKRTAEVLQAFRDAGGREMRVSEEELRTLDALRRLRLEGDPLFGEWLAERRPASGLGFLAGVLAPAAPESTASATPQMVVPAPRTSPEHEGERPSIGLGRRLDSAAPFAVDVESLRRHCVVFAGSGSGKTVLIRRIVEEAALQGVSSIVLDPNNDLARLGDGWPEPPPGWGPHDADRAQAYLDDTEVVVWTPRVLSGRPLAFQPLPDFAGVRDSADELDQAIRSAVEALAPRAGVAGATRLAKQGKAVLTEALQEYALGRRSGLRGFVDFLAELPDGVSSMARAEKLAHDAAETLKAAMVTDPLFGGEGAAADPGVLLTPSEGRRARVSVISFVGLPSDEERQSFVNQLQMALFAWIKRHPAGDRPLGGLLVMDEAQTLAPSSGMTACTASTIALASQARKYGLGLLFATQAPKGLHSRISGNATTQFFGLLNSPVHIDAAKEIAAAKGGRVPDIGMLKSGQFYAAGEGFSFVRVDTPMCLSHHPKAPLTQEEVIDRARRTVALVR